MLRSEESISPFELAKVLRVFLRTKTVQSVKRIFEISDSICPVLNTSKICCDADCAFASGRDCFIAKADLEDCLKRINDQDMALLYLEITIRMAKWDATPRIVKDRLRRLTKEGERIGAI